MAFNDQFNAIVQVNGLDIDEIKVSLFERYISHLLAYNVHTNLTAHRDVDVLLEKGVLDSLLFPELATLMHGRWLDVGSGAGFPGVPLAICYPHTSWTLLEPIQKKARFLMSLTHLSIPVTVISDRAEIWIKHERETFDGVVSRAVAPLNILTELCLPFVSIGGVFLAYKGDNGHEELIEATRAIEQLGGVVETIVTQTLPRDGAHRQLIVIRKIKATPNGYPRMFSHIKKSPL
jgi:16S rRNA (guanine527-N7)-methyltransferase